MEAKELRIGNFVEKNGIICKSVAIHENGSVTLHGEDFYYTENSHWVNPVPLTEEWLLKFGFKKIILQTAINGFNIVFYKLNNFCVYLLKSSFEIELIRQDGKQFNLFINSKKEVHQLQNLYFALTNKELIIKQ